MDIEPFALERWLARHEHGNRTLAESGVRSLSASRFDTGESFCERLIEEGVALAPGDYFGHPDSVRIGFGLETDDWRRGWHGWTRSWSATPGSPIRQGRRTVDLLSALHRGPCSALAALLGSLAFRTVYTASPG